MTTGRVRKNIETLKYSGQDSFVSKRRKCIHKIRHPEAKKHMHLIVFSRIKPFLCDK